MACSQWLSSIWVARSTKMGFAFVSILSIYLFSCLKALWKNFWSCLMIESAFEIKTDMLGRSDPELKSSGKILNRLIHVDSDGWKLEADPRHAELLIEAMGVRDGKTTSYRATGTRRRACRTGKHAH